MKKRTLTPGLPLPAFTNRKADASAPVPQQEVTEQQPIAQVENHTSHTDAVIRNNETDDTIITINVALIDQNPFAPREIYTPEMISSRAESMRLHGQYDAIHVIPNPNHHGRYIIADGWTRVQACIEHKITDTIRATVHYGLTAQEAAWLGYEQNEEREQHCDLDRAIFFEKLISLGESQDEIAKRTHISKTLMSFYRSYAKLPPDVLDIVRSDAKRFSASSVYQLSRITSTAGVRKAVAIASRYATEDHPYRWLVNQAQALINPTKHKASTPLKHIRYGNGYYKQRGDGFEINITVEEDKREAFSLALEDLLKTVAITEKQTEDVAPKKTK